MKTLTTLQPNDQTYKYYYKLFGANYVVYENVNSDIYPVVYFGPDQQITAMNLTLRLINKDIAQQLLHEAITDIGINVGAAGFISINSRLVVDMVIKWAKEFETINAGCEWGVDTDLDYIEAIDLFSDQKIKQAVIDGMGYIDTQKDENYDSDNHSYVMAYMDKSEKDHFQVWRAGEDAKNESLRAYNNIIQASGTSIALVAKIITSTDY